LIVLGNRVDRIWIIVNKGCFRLGFLGGILLSISHIGQSRILLCFGILVLILICGS